MRKSENITRGKNNPSFHFKIMYGQFNTFIDDPKMINVLLRYEWIIIKDLWTNCPEKTYNKLKGELL